MRAKTAQAKKIHFYDNLIILLAYKRPLATAPATDTADYLNAAD